MENIEIVEAELLAADLSEPDFCLLPPVEKGDEGGRRGDPPSLPFSKGGVYEDLAECLQCPPGDPPPSLWQRGLSRLGYSTDRVLEGIGQAARNILAAFLATLHSIVSAPGRFIHWVAHWPWAEMLTIRKGFIFGAVGGFLVGSSTLWALSTLPYLPGHPIEPLFNASRDLPMARLTVPAELAWFFIQFPYISENAQIRIKNHHTFVVADNSRKKEYVVMIGQKFRRVEIYAPESKGALQVQVFTPGSKRTVWFQGTKIVGQTRVIDGNLWMWRGPLWNSVHLKIYGLADLWLDSPYKKYSCAGFVHKFLSDAGVNVPILDAWDIAKQPWMQVPVEEMEPGDIITIKAASAAHRHFWHHRITHVGVYIGHGKFIHAATISPRSTRSWVRIADVDDFRPRIDKVLRPPELQ